VDPDDSLLPPRVRLVVLFGGQSAEHDVSRVSAREVLSALDRTRYEIVPIAIGRDGRWMDAVGTRELLDAGGPLPPPALDASGPPVDLLPTLRPLVEAQPDAVPTVVFPVLHGPMGEDGTIQGLLELCDVPYVGSGVLGSALAMDKAKAKEVLAAAGVPQARWRSAHAAQIDAGFLADAAGELGFPIFVKPANMGSSVGVTRVADATTLLDAVKLALTHDEWIVLEESVRGRELEIGVLGGTSLATSVIGEVVPGAEFYDYEDKYVHGKATIIIPADLEPAVADEISQLATVAFRALRAEILGRADFFLADDGRVIFNELNTLPGCTPISMFPSLWAATGLDYPALLDELIRLALARHRRQRSYRS